MKTNRGVCGIFFLMGGILAVLGIVLALSSRNAAPVMLKKPEGAAQAAQDVLEAVCAGEYDRAGQGMYGTPVLGTGDAADSETGRILWEAFVDSLEYRLVGDCYVTDRGICQKVSIRALELPSVTANLKERAQTLLKQRVDEAENMDEVYDENNSYREGFVMNVLREAAQAAIAEDGVCSEQELELNLVYDRGRWWVVPSQNLINAISGGISG